MPGMPPHLSTNTPITSRRGHFFVPGEITPTPAGTMLAGSMYVHWEAPAEPTTELPVILIHGGGGQGTDWLQTPDGRPGWVDRFVALGHPVYVVDRPGHGRSPRHPDLLGEATPQFSYEFAEMLWAPSQQGEAQTQWLWGREQGDPVIDQLVASGGSMSLNLAVSQALEGRQLSALLDIVGRSAIVTHSAGAPGGWLLAALRPELVAGIVAIEPMGPPFADFPGVGSLAWGLTHAPIEYDPPVADPAELQQPVPRVIPGLSEVPVVVVTSETSWLGAAGAATVEFLTSVGAAAELMHLPDLGIYGNGHGLIFEANSHETIKPVARWIQALPATQL
jgi:pimeloyl-ACP methyl ester carboxylesterase